MTKRKLRLHAIAQLDEDNYDDIKKDLNPDESFNLDDVYDFIEIEEIEESA